MGVERRDCVIQFCRLVNQLCADNRKGGTVNRDKEGANRQDEVVEISFAHWTKIRCKLNNKDPLNAVKSRP